MNSTPGNSSQIAQVKSPQTGQAAASVITRAVAPLTQQVTSLINQVTASLITQVSPLRQVSGARGGGEAMRGEVQGKGA